ncbi:flagellar type III secretion system pore protein FliP [bacterium]|nr:flagellar type III secretion system pore protein FliP [bacterium]MDC1444427.1 flagellar type III secretion system pore protein FliP [bacterium]
MQPGADGSESYSTNIQILLIMTLLSVLPALLMTMTSFTRIIVVLAILRQAMGTMQTPSNQILIGLALFTSMFIMMPAFEEIYEKAVEPYMAGDLVFESALDEGVQPLRVFMLNQTREVDLMMFASLAGVDSFDQDEEIPLHILLPSFVTSELKTAFQIGFLIFIPFLIIDLVVASVLMSMGMMMLSPMIISLPFKIMLFVLVDGWSLVLGTLAASFYS